MKSTLALLLVLSVVFGCGQSNEPTPPAAPAPVASHVVGSDGVKYLANGLTAADRQSFYHLSEGSEVFPLVLVKAGRDKLTKKPFVDVLEKFGFVKDPNPAAAGSTSLGYVGLTVSELKGVTLVGVNCTACHVGQIEANGHMIRVDGAPNMLYINQFFSELATAVTPPNLDLKVLVEEIEKEHAAKPPNTPKPTVGDIIKYIEHMVALAGLSKGTPALPGRADAFGAARMIFFGDKQPLSAPASLPPLWSFQSTAWFHYIGNTQSALERNIGQSLGLGAFFDTKTCATSINFENLDQMEKMAYKVHPASWPEDLLGKLDTAKAAAGKTLYMGKCAKCHDNWATEENGGTRRAFLQFPLSLMKTDDAEAFNTSRPVTFNPNMCTAQPATKQTSPFSAAHQVFVGRIRDKFFETHPEAKAQEASWGDHRTSANWVDSLVPPLCTGNKLNCKIYVAKPLVGIWATAPFLHNGAVSSIMELLTDEAQRRTSFSVGQRAYDTANLGYVAVAPTPPAYTFEIANAGKAIEGNSNRGHSGPQFGTDMTQEQKLQMIEFLKSLKDGDQEKLRQEFQSKPKQ